MKRLISRMFTATPLILLAAVIVSGAIAPEAHAQKRSGEVVRAVVVVSQPVVVKGQAVFLAEIVDGNSRKGAANPTSKYILNLKDSFEKSHVSYHEYTNTTRASLLLEIEQSRVKSQTIYIRSNPLAQGFQNVRQVYSQPPGDYDLFKN